MVSCGKFISKISAKNFIPIQLFPLLSFLTKFNSTNRKIGIMDICHSYLLSSQGLLKIFSLQPATIPKSFWKIR